MHLILQLSEGRRRATEAARSETLSLLALCEPSLPAGGPFGEISGVYWVDLARPAPDLTSRLALLGYACAAHELAPASISVSGPRRPRGSTGSLPATVRWRGRWYTVRELWRRDKEEEREAAPDRRAFVLPDASGESREVRGYRGSRRALPPADARLTVNLSLTPGCRRLLDPFAGAGGIVTAARPHDLEVFSADIDPILRYGLAVLGASHCVADARHLPLADGTIDAVASEPPYLPELTAAVGESLSELARIVRPGGRICFFYSQSQSPELLAAPPPSLRVLHRFPIDRKGTACEALVWERR
jgi:SAM-dependent methyltransferase